MRNRAFVPSLKKHPAYKADREAKLTRLAVETPDCEFLECQDCCYLERKDDAWSTRRFVPLICPECDGQLLIGIIAGGEVHG